MSGGILDPVTCRCSLYPSEHVVSLRTRRLHHSLYGNPALSNGFSDPLNDAFIQAQQFEDLWEREDVDIEEEMMFSDLGMHYEYLQFLTIRLGHL